MYIMVGMGVVDLYNQGMSVRDISKKLGISRYYVNKELSGLDKRKPWERVFLDTIKWKTKDERDKLIIDLYCTQKLGAHKIARMLSIGKRTVFRVLHNNNIETDKNRTNKLELDVNYINELYNDGLTIEQIAFKLGVTDGSISCRLSKLGRISRSERLSIISSDHKSTIINKYKNGKSIYDLSDEFEYHPEVIRRFLNKVKIIRPVEERRKLAAKKLSNRKCFLSKPQKGVEEILHDLNINFIREYPISEWSYDIYVPDNKLLIEVQGEYWHKLRNRRQRDNKKMKVAKDNGYLIKYVWESYLKNRKYLKSTIKYWLGIHNLVNYEFRDLEIFVDSIGSGKPLIDYHYLGKFGNNGMLITATLDDVPVITTMFSPPTRQEIAKKQKVKFGEILELSRMSVNPIYQKRNLVSYFLARAAKIIRNQKPDIRMLVSFADHSHGHFGYCYKASGWTYDGETRPNYWYQKDRNIIHKKKIWDLAKKNGSFESDYAKQNGFIRVNGHSKSRFVKILR